MAIRAQDGSSRTPSMPGKTVWAATLPLLESQTDYPENAVTFDAILASEQGDYFTVPRAIAIYERDGGLGWKHYDEGHNRNESRRARELIFSWIATVGNYDYAFNWIFHQDGILEMEVGLTGYMDTKAVKSKTSPMRFTAIKMLI